MNDMNKVLEKSEVSIVRQKERLLLTTKCEYSATNQVGTGGLNDLISRQEAVVLMQLMNQKIHNEIQKDREKITSAPIELENIQRTLDYVIWALRELPSANKEDLRNTELRPLIK